MVMGVGINVGRQDFPTEIAQTAACLEQERGYPVPRAEIIVNVMKAFEGYYEIFCRDGNLAGLLERYNGMLAGKDGEVRVLDPKGEYRGISRGINSTGELLVEREDGAVEAVYAGEVSVRGIYGYV